MLALLAATTVAILAADVVTKQLVVGGLEGRAPIRLLGGAVYLVAIRNSGAAFSLGRSHTLIFPLLTIAAIGWIGWMAKRLRSVPWAVALGLVLGGASGNLVDRIFRAPGFLRGHVVDFVAVGWWPVFNVADSCVTIGAILLIVRSLRPPPPTRPSPPRREL